jgi:hypothetical protein
VLEQSEDGVVELGAVEALAELLQGDRHEMPMGPRALDLLAATARRLDNCWITRSGSHRLPAIARDAETKGQPQSAIP